MCGTSDMAETKENKMKGKVGTRKISLNNSKISAFSSFRCRCSGFALRLQRREAAYLSKLNQKITQLVIRIMTPQENQRY